MNDCRLADVILAILLMATASVLVERQRPASPATPVRAAAAPART